MPKKEALPIKDRDRIERMQTMLAEGTMLHSQGKWRPPNKRDALLFRLGVHSMLRISDLLQLRVKDILKDGEFREHWRLEEQKTGKQKRVKLDETTQQMIRKYLADPPDPKDHLTPDDYIFYSLQNPDKPIDRHQAWRRLVPVAEEAGIRNFTVHSMRKTLPYFVYQDTKDIVLCQKMLNHDSPSTTLRYLGIDQEEIDAAVANFAV